MPAVPYLEPAEVRERIAVGGGPPLDPSVFDNTWVAEAVDVVRDKVETACGVAFTPTTTVETVPVPGCGGRLLLEWPKIRSVTSITVNGTALAATDYVVDAKRGFITLRSTPAWDAVIVVTYVHGFDINDSDGPSSVLKRMTAAYVDRLAAHARSSSTRDVRVEGMESGASTVYVLPRPGTWQVTGFSEFDADLAGLPHYRRAGVA